MNPSRSRNCLFAVGREISTNPMPRGKVVSRNSLVLRSMMLVQSLTSSLHFTLSTTLCQSSNLT